LLLAITQRGKSFVNSGDRCGSMHDRCTALPPSVFMTNAWRAVLILALIAARFHVWTIAGTFRELVRIYIANTPELVQCNKFVKTVDHAVNATRTQYPDDA
jgi:hypothetical protein